MLELLIFLLLLLLLLVVYGETINSITVNVTIVLANVGIVNFLVVIVIVNRSVW